MDLEKLLEIIGNQEVINYMLSTVDGSTICGKGTIMVVDSTDNIINIKFDDGGYIEFNIQNIRKIEQVDGCDGYNTYCVSSENGQLFVSGKVFSV